MIDINGGRIWTSYGDSLCVVFKVIGYTMADTDKTAFSIRKDGAFVNDRYVVYSEDVPHDASYVYVTIPAEAMGKIPVGRYIYDVTLTTEGGAVLTLNFPRFLKVIGVAHDE